MTNLFEELQAIEDKENTNDLTVFVHTHPEITDELKKDLVDLFEMTYEAPQSGASNLSFLTFLLANFSPDTVASYFPALTEFYKNIRIGE